MNSRERIKKIIAGEPADRCGFWLGNPDPASWEMYYQYFGTSSQEEIRQRLGCEFRWIAPWHAYQSPDGKGLFTFDKKAFSDRGPLADCECVDELEASFAWPKLEYLNFSAGLEELRRCGDYYRASGLWTCFYHNLMDLFGMEEYMVKMITHPEVVKAATDRVCQFYYDANVLFFAEAGDLIDGFFFGNDFGTQRDVICGPAQFDEHILPWFKKFVDLAHAHNYQAILHSCGSIHKVIDRLIASGVDCLHPIQAKAENMDAERLANDFGGQISFMGGIDTQELLIHGSTEEVKAEVQRVKRVLGPRLIISPSHEAVLPDIPVVNVIAMAEAAISN